MRVQLIYAHLNNPNSTPPMGIISLGTHLKAHGVETDLYDLSFDKDLSGLIARLDSFQPDIIGISSMTLSITTAFDAARRVRELFPKAVLVFGGPHATALPQETLRDPAVDVVVIGEGETTLLNLVRALEKKEDLSAVKGIGYKKDGAAVFTGEQPFIEDLDELGLPDRELLPTFARYLAVPPGFPYLMPWTYLMVGRGCPYQCTFCQPMLKKLFGHKVRLRSPQKVADEMELLLERYGVKSVYFADDTFIANPAWVKSFHREIRNRNLHKRLVWMAQTNVNTINDEIVALLRDAGCVFLAFGVEGGNEEILRNVMKKNQTRLQINKAFALCKKHGLLTEAALIIGCAEDTVETVTDTVTLVEEINPDIIDIHYMTPTPGSALFDTYASKGVLHYQQWADPDRYTPGLIKSATLTREELERLYDRIVEAYLKHKSIFRVNPFWFRWLFNLLFTGRNFERFYKLFILQFLMLNSYAFNRLFKRLIRIKYALVGKRHP